MAYLDNTSITVDAILTKKGRERLAEGRQNFQITQFALSDDEIDYTLWDAKHPLGSNYYGAVIENMPLLEAFPDETQVMRSKLVTLPKGSTRIPTLTLNGLVTIEVEANNDTPVNLLPGTNNVTADTQLGYTLVVHDARYVDVNVTPGFTVDAQFAPTIPAFIGDTTQKHSATFVGKRFDIFGNGVDSTLQRTTQVTIIGNESGAQITVDLTRKAEPVTNQGGGAG
tara:strand:- start:1171 stop:1848 length:678 start_codon:yes stop_codon:yes gene_type:complete